MMKNKDKSIKLLNDEVASQIAAGEVIERPSSVVKELVENAIDAGATDIRIFIELAGKQLIKVTDNGKGIPNDQLNLAVMRHATSKLTSAEDLFSIETLGFRGEALASIASVSNFELSSRVEEESMGGRIVVEGGTVHTIDKIGVPTGTSVQVRNLFYNVPARLKFLKTDTTEKKKISELVSRYALAYPEIRFKLVSDQSILLESAGNGDHRELLAELYGLEIAKKMLSVKLREGNYEINGYISPVSITRSNRNEIIFFVNGRWVQDTTLAAALMRAYHTLIMTGRYPLAILFIQLPVNEVDVNVHPTKAEVRFTQNDYMFSLLQRATRRALLAYSSVPEISPKIWQTPSQTTENEETQLSWTPARVLNQFDEPFQSEFSKGVKTNNHQEAIETAPTSNEDKDNSPEFDIPLLRPVGQVGLAYLVAEGPDGLYLIDQHAAHERILFEKLLGQLEASIPTQVMLTPETVTLSPHQSILLEQNLPVLRKLGFAIENFGPNLFQVRGIPVLLSGINPEAAIRVVVEDFEDDETPLKNVIEQKIAARVCKRAAVKAGQSLTRMEQEALIRDLERCISPRTCPHGRPTMIHLSVDLLEKQFGRKGSI